MHAPSAKLRRLIVNADDFGRSHSINMAVVRAHHEGILTSASLMVNEPACGEAVELARECPDLGVGLHLSLVCGKAALPPSRIPRLVNSAGLFSSNPVAAGLRYFFHKSLEEELRLEIRAQFEQFRATGLRLDHLNGHLHMHLHPAVLRILIEEKSKLGWNHIRLTWDPFSHNLRLARGRLAYRAAHAFIFSWMAPRAAALFARHGGRHTQHVFGVLQNAKVDEDYVLRLLRSLPPGDSELYSHPSLDEFKHELDALISLRVIAQVRESAIQLIRYQDL